MDALSKIVLSEIHKNEKLSGSIIAGGYVRDHILGGPFKDVDIFVPLHKDDRQEVIDIIMKGLGGNFSDLKLMRDPKYKAKVGYIGGVIECTYRDVVPVQFILHLLDEKMDFEGFSNHIFKDFDFGINQASFDGMKIYESKEFNNDRYGSKATLLEIHDNLENLVSGVLKFQRLKEKYPYLKFDTTLEITNPKNKIKERKPKEEEFKHLGEYRKMAYEELYDKYGHPQFNAYAASKNQIFGNFG